MQDARRNLNQPNAGQLGHHPQQVLHHPRQAGLIHQQHHPNSPRQSPNLQSTPQGPYLSPHSSTQSLPPQQYHSPYIGSAPAIQHQHPGEAAFFGTHPSPYSTDSAAGSYASSEPGDSMATHAAMNRPQYPPISSYQTPLSNSPASIHSPQTDPHGRPMYPVPSMPQQMYYPQQYQMQQSPYSQQQSPYAQHPPTPQHPSITSAPGTLMSYQAPQQHMQHSQHQLHHGNQGHPRMIDSKPSPASLQRPPSIIAPPHGAPPTPTAQPTSAGLPVSASMPNPSAAPGPIPATTPLVVRQDQTGVQWIAFEYSRDRVKMEYTIRCDVESVNTDELSQEFKSANCVYPRACGSKDQYKGNRLHYETECNAVGWALAQLNPPLREKRGLIQRAVDSWRNSNQDPRLRSRRVRRMAKIQNRKTTQVGPGTAGQPGSQGMVVAGSISPEGMIPAAFRLQEPGPGGPQMHHHRAPRVKDEDDDLVSNEQGNAHHHQPPSNVKKDDMSSSLSSVPRPSQNFVPTYPQQPGVVSQIMPPMHDTMDPMQSQYSVIGRKRMKQESDDEEDESRKRTLFGDVPESKRRKFILVEDGQRGGRVRVRVMLDQVNMDEMPDAHLKINSVYPRSYFPRQSGSSIARSEWDDDSDDAAEGDSGTAPTKTKTIVPVPLMDGSEAKLPLPRMTKSRRNKEIALNELGHRMSWSQPRTFNGRTLFLQRSLDAYRNKMRNTMLHSGQESGSIASHFETRPGKRRWFDRSKSFQEKQELQRRRRSESP